MTSYLSEKLQILQNHKILRYRSCLAQISVLCANLKNLNVSMLSAEMCEILAGFLGQISDLRKNLQKEINIQKAMRTNVSQHTVYHMSNHIHYLSRANVLPTRSTLLLMVREQCEITLSELHTINYEYISNEGHSTLAAILTLCSKFRDEVSKEQAEQTQRKKIDILRKAS